MFDKTVIIFPLIFLIISRVEFWLNDSYKCLMKLKVINILKQVSYLNNKFDLEFMFNNINTWTILKNFKTQLRALP